MSTKVTNDRKCSKFKLPREFHLDSSTTSDNGVVLNRPADDHDGVVERPLRLLHELLGPAAQHDRARLALGHPGEQVEPLPADLLLLKVLARSEGAVAQIVDCGLDGAAARLHGADEVLLGDAAGAEHVAVGKVLRGDVADGELGEHNLGTGSADGVQLLVEDVPLGVDDLLVLLDVVDADLGVVLLGLELQLDVEEGDLGVGVVLGLHLEPGVGESLLEGHALDEEGVLKRTTRNLEKVKNLLEILDQDKNALFICFLLPEVLYFKPGE